MSKYKLNQKYENLSVEEIFILLLKSIEIGKTYSTLSGREEHKVIKIEGEITVERMDAMDIPNISFNEIRNVIKLFKSGNYYNTSSQSYKDLLEKPTHKTPLLSILLMSQIITKHKSK